MSYFLIILLCLFALYGTIQTGCAFNLLGYIILAILLVLAWEHKVFICILLLSFISLCYLVPRIIDYYKYKDETPEEKQKREEWDKEIQKVQEWSRWNHC